MLDKFDLFQRTIIKIYALVLGLGISYTMFIKLTGLGIPCVFYTFTGIQCPGCGSTRMFLAAFRGEFLEAFAYNPAAFVSAIVWGLISILAFVGKPDFVRTEKFLSMCIYCTLALYVIVDLWRNLILFI